MSSPVLWQNKDRTVTILDIPRSIAAAQGTSEEIFSRHLLSTTPLLSPYATNEPKSEKARAKVRSNTVESELHTEYEAVIRHALNEAEDKHVGDWCAPRALAGVYNDCESTKKRRKDLKGDCGDVSVAIALSSDSKDPEPPHDLLPGLVAGNDRKTITYDLRSRSGEHDETNAIDSGPLAFRCESAEPSQLTILHNGGRYRYLLPPASVAFLADCQDSRVFHNEVRRQAQDFNTHRHFDFILLDPPWPNRSVKRTHKTPGTSYQTAATLHDISDLNLNMDLDMLMADDCLVGIWITNKSAIRDLVLNDIFGYWGLELEEEWLWLKTTVSGEPVTPLDSLWRKPYEVLLLGRKRRRGSANTSTSDARYDADPGMSMSMGAGLTKRRVVVSVPDLHSRKPCIKELIEPMLSDREGYRALEVFARHLVAGWWSWGNECLKFNWQGYWIEPDQ